MNLNINNIIHYLFLIISGLWAVPAILLIRAIRPFALIRLGNLSWLAAGHFVLDAAEQKARIQIQPINTIDWFWIPKKTCNEQWAKMVCRNLPVYSWVYYLDRWNHLLPYGEEHYRLSSSTKSRDLEGLFQKYDVRFKFLQEEEKIAKNWLLQKGWREGEPFVCVIIRDNEYQKQHPLHGAGKNNSPKSRNYHSYRNSDIDTYISSMEWLANQGLWVLRMGKIMGKPVNSKHPKIIDYPFLPDKSDLLDIWLFANCNFSISVGTGIDNVSHVYNKPILFLNAMTLIELLSFHKSSYVPKHLYCSENQKPLNVTEHFLHGYRRFDEYADAGIEIIDLSSDEILESVKEFWYRLQGTWNDTDEDLERQKRFMEILKTCSDFSMYHRWIHSEYWVGSMWLRNRGEEFLT